jgi:hypothetical protein
LLLPSWEAGPEVLPLIVLEPMITLPVPVT